MNANLQTVEIVIPVYDEERALGPNVELLLGYLRSEFPFPFRVVVADNASSDATPDVAARARAAATRRSSVPPARGKRAAGRALRTAWLASNADVVSYMDVDLSTNLDELPAARRADPVRPQRARDRHPARTPGARPPAAEARGALARLQRARPRRLPGALLRRPVRLQGAARRRRPQRLLPLVADEGWFFDTELLLLAERNGLRIHEVPGRLGRGSRLARRPRRRRSPPTSRGLVACAPRVLARRGVALGGRRPRDRSRRERQPTSSRRLAPRVRRSPRRTRVALAASSRSPPSSTSAS